MCFTNLYFGLQTGTCIVLTPLLEYLLNSYKDGLACTFMLMSSLSTILTILGKDVIAISAHRLPLIVTLSPTIDTSGECRLADHCSCNGCVENRFRPFLHLITSLITGTMPLAAGFVGIIPALGLLDPSKDGIPPLEITWIHGIGWSLAVAFFG